MSTATPAVVLTVAGSDSGGGAGIAADLATFAAFGVHATLVITLVTAQNTRGVDSVFPLPGVLLEAQLDSVLADFDVAAAKTGLLSGVDAVQAVVERSDRIPNLVVDPVLVTSKGSAMFDNALTEAYLDRLFPLALVVTPNVAEASLLTGVPIESRVDATAAAATLVERGARHVVVTGLIDAGEAVDVHASDDGVRELVAPAVATRNVHGTGCSFSAAIVSRLALGDSPEAAIEAAKAYVTAAIVSAARWEIGGGQGPIDHTAGND